MFLLDRRSFISTVLATRTLRGESLPPVRPITKGPKFHWFGYYDKLQFDPSSRYALGMEGAIEHRLPTANDFVRLGMVDTQDGDNGLSSLRATHGAGIRDVCCSGCRARARM